MRNIIITDSSESELYDLKEGLEEVSGKWEIKSFISNWGRTSFRLRLKRYLMYFYAPFKIFIKRKDYSQILGWQQFYSLIFAFYCKFFHVKKTFKLYVVNFTYKKKRGLIGKIYYSFMKYILTSKYIDMIFVPSIEYIESCANEFNISSNIIKTLPFGISDQYKKYKNKSIKENYILSIGRSNRDYNWLINEWNNIDYPLYIISDTYKPELKIPNNVHIINNISGEKQYPYIMGCRALIIPIKEEKICSGDTVLLTAMSFKKNVIVTEKSTLAELYINEGENGFIVSKKEGKLKIIVDSILKGKLDLSSKARNSFLENFSRRAMGRRIGDYIK